MTEPPLFWLHADSAARARRLASLSEALLQASGVTIVLTHQAHSLSLPDTPRRRVLALQAGAEQARALIAAHRPTALLVAADVLPATLLDLARQAGLPVLIADMAEPVWRGLRMHLPGNRRAALATVRQVFLTSEQTRAAWLALLPEAARITFAGPLGEIPPAPTCNEAERDALAISLRQRPVWLALNIPEPEEAAIIAAHRDALRAAHRLLLILHPADPARGAALKEGLERDFQVAQRSDDDPIGSETQVYIVDTEGERGLWYRLASVCFIGGTLSGGVDGPSPLEPASLGCAVLHGPRPGPHQDAFRLLARAGASLPLTRPEDLGAQLCDALRPDMAASLAHRAWQSLSEGAEAQALICDALTALATERTG